MDDAPSSARDAAARGSRRADQLIALIMSGRKPAVVDHAPGAGKAVSAPATPASRGEFWSAPPDRSNAPQPRVEAGFARGAAQYRTRSVPQRQPANSQPGIYASAPAPPAPRPALAPVTRLAPLAPTDLVGPQPELVRIPGIEPADPEPAARHLLHIAPMRAHNEHTPPPTAKLLMAAPEPIPSADPATPIAAVDESASSPLAAAIEPYVRPQPESAIDEFSERAKARRAWRKAY
jgi:hypothetical protein